MVREANESNREALASGGFGGCYVCDGWPDASEGHLPRAGGIFAMQN